MMRFVAQCCAVVILGCLAMSASGAELGLSVREGQLVLKGEPYRGIGANCFSLFARTLKDPTDKSYEQGLSRLSNAGVPFVRFMAGGFWPVDWDLYLRDKEAHFARLDGVVESAERNRVGLIPSLFWNMATVPDIVGEPMDQWGNADSRAIAFIRNYTREVVTRYKDSPAVWGWEFGNEYNLHVDLPNAAQRRPPVVPNLKTALKRTQRDELTSQAMVIAFAQFAKTVRQYDKHRILITGNSVPRPSAYHNSTEQSWRPDSPDQFRKILLRDNPDPFDTISVHAYPKRSSDYPGGAKSPAALVKTVHDFSKRAGKPLFLGEFGVPRSDSRDKDRASFVELLEAIEANGVPLAAFWVFDYPRQDRDWNVTFENDRRYMLKLVGEANRRMKTKP